MKALNLTISKEAIEDAYLIQNKSVQETAKMFGCTGPQLRVLLKRYGISKDRKKTSEVTKRRNLEKYGVESTNQLKSVKEKKKQSYLEHFGVENPGQIESVKEQSRIRLNSPEIVEKRTVSLRNRTQEQWSSSVAQIRQTKLERYGDENFNNVEKTRETYIGKYGVPYSVPGHEKMKQTNLKKYGVEQYSQTEEAKKRIKKTKFEKYGGWFNLEAVKQTKVQRYGDPFYNNREKARQTNWERYGVDWYVVDPNCQSKFKVNSRPNREFATLLDENGISYEQEFPIKYRSYDFKVGQILIEINPFPTHNSTWGIAKGEPTDPKYHFEKSQLARENGYRCIHVWDWDDREKILMMLQERKPLYARKLNLQEISQTEANRFLKQFHMQGRSKGQTVCLGLYKGSELMEVMTFGKPRFNKNYEWELIRLCTRPGWFVVGGAERLFKTFLIQNRPNSIVSYCDWSKFSGEVYTRIGFTLKNPGIPSRHWYNFKTGVHVTDNGLRMKGFDKLFGEQYGKFGKGTSNDDLMRQHDFVEIWDAGQAVYEWHR